MRFRGGILPSMCSKSEAFGGSIGAVWLDKERGLRRRDSCFDTAHLPLHVHDEDFF